MQILMGNVAARKYPPGMHGGIPSAEGIEAAEIWSTPCVTRFSSPDEVPLMEVLNSITTVPRGAWFAHSAEAPAWVWSDNEVVAQMLAQHYGCDVGIPNNVEDEYHTDSGPPGVGKTPKAVADRPGALGAVIATTMALMLFMATRLMLRTKAGIDHQSRVQFDTASTGTGSYAPLVYLAVTETAVAIDDDDTTLSGEITGEGLARVIISLYSHTNGTNTTTLTKTLTKTSGGTARTLRTAGLFNASSAGTMGFETAIPDPPTLVISDSTAFTWVFTF